MRVTLDKNEPLSSFPVLSVLLTSTFQHISDPNLGTYDALAISLKVYIE